MILFIPIEKIGSILALLLFILRHVKYYLRNLALPSHTGCDMKAFPCYTTHFHWFFPRKISQCLVLFCSIETFVIWSFKGVPKGVVIVFNFGCPKLKKISALMLSPRQRPSNNGSQGSSQGLPRRHHFYMLCNFIFIIEHLIVRWPKKTGEMLNVFKNIGSCLKTGQHSILVIIRKIKKLIHVCWIPQIDDFIFIIEQYFHY